MKADLLDAFETLSTLVATLGFPVFEPLIRNESADRFYVRGPDAEASGELVEDGFVIRAGAIARKDIVPSAVESVTPMRNKLVESGVLIEEDGHFRFTQDYLFNTPSGAAAVVLGRTSNGWVDRKDSQGKSLNEVRRSAPEPDE
jgi:hypothetical protein